MRSTLGNIKGLEFTEEENINMILMTSQEKEIFVRKKISELDIYYYLTLYNETAICVVFLIALIVFEFKI